MSIVFEKKLSAALSRHFKSSRLPCPAPLAKAIRYSLLAPGKRIRPRLCFASAQALGLTSQSVMPAAIAIEMIHCFSLIHDDLPCMDDDDFRRGKPSNHKKFGESNALLAGDALNWIALDVLLEASTIFAPQGVLAAISRLSDATGPRGMIGGQAAESQLSSQSSFSSLKKMHSAKTGALFEAALLLPADLAGLKPKTYRELHTFSRILGAAFQVADDLDDALQDDLDFTNVLRYRSKSRVVKETRTDLLSALLSLKDVYGTQAHKLIEIGAQVLETLK